MICTARQTDREIDRQTPSEKGASTQTDINRQQVNLKCRVSFSNCVYSWQRITPTLWLKIRKNLVPNKKNQEPSHLLNPNPICPSPIHGVFPNVMTIPINIDSSRLCHALPTMHDNFLLPWERNPHLTEFLAKNLGKPLKSGLGRKAKRTHRRIP